MLNLKKFKLFFFIKFKIFLISKTFQISNYTYMYIYVLTNIKYICIDKLADKSIIPISADIAPIEEEIENYLKRKIQEMPEYFKFEIYM